MKILSIGSDKQLARSANPLNDSQRRQNSYAEHLTQFTIIVRTPKGAEFAHRQLSENLEVLPTLSKRPWRFFIDAWRLGKKILQNNDYELITVQEPFYCGLIGYLLAKRFKLPLNIQLHSDFFDNPYWLDEDWKNKALSPLGKYLIKRADSLRVVSGTIKNKLIAQGLEGKRIFVCPIGVELENFQSADGAGIRREYLKNENGFFVLSVGRLVPAKDYDTLLKVAQLVRERVENVKFVLVGDGKEGNRLREAVKEKNLEENVVLAGAVDYKSLPGYYAACDIFLLTSIFEGFGRVLVEAGAAAKPVVCTATAGAQEIILDQKSGFLTAIGDYRKLAERIISLLNNPRAREEMGRLGRAQVNEFHFEKTVRLLINGWRRTLSL